MQAEEVAAIISPEAQQVMLAAGFGDPHVEPGSPWVEIPHDPRRPHWPDNGLVYSLTVSGRDALGLAPLVERGRTAVDRAALSRAGLNRLLLVEYGSQYRSRHGLPQLGLSALPCVAEIMRYAPPDLEIRTIPKEERVPDGPSSRLNYEILRTGSVVGWAARGWDLEGFLLWDRSLAEIRDLYLDPEALPFLPQPRRTPWQRLRGLGDRRPAPQPRRPADRGSDSEE